MVFFVGVSKFFYFQKLFTLISIYRIASIVRGAMHLRAWAPNSAPRDPEGSEEKNLTHSPRRRPGRQGLKTKNGVVRKAQVVVTKLPPPPPPPPATEGGEGEGAAEGAEEEIPSAEAGAEGEAKAEGEAAS